MSYFRPKELTTEHQKELIDQALHRLGILGSQTSAFIWFARCFLHLLELFVSFKNH